MIFSFDYFGSQVSVESMGTDWVPSADEVISVHSVPITHDGKVIAVHVVGRGVDIPGGHLDEGESILDAMHREAWEEATIRMENPVLLDVTRLSSDNASLGLEARPYMLLYGTKVSALEPFEANDEVDERREYTPKEFVDEYFADKSYSEWLVEKALDATR